MWSCEEDCLVLPYRTCFAQFRRFRRQTEIHALYILPLSQHLNSLGMQMCLFSFSFQCTQHIWNGKDIRSSRSLYYSHVSKHQNKLKFVCIRHFRGAALYTVGHQRALHLTNSTTVPLFSPTSGTGVTSCFTTDILLFNVPYIYLDDISNVGHVFIV